VTTGLVFGTVEFKTCMRQLPATHGPKWMGMGSPELCQFGHDL